MKGEEEDAVIARIGDGKDVETVGRLRDGYGVRKGVVVIVCAGVGSP